MANKRKFGLIVLVLVLLASIFLFAACHRPKLVEKSSRDFEHMGEKPADSTLINIDSLGATDDEKVFALYSIALDNLRDTPYCAAYNEGWFECYMLGQNNILYDDYIIMKTPNKYFFCNYRAIKECPIAENALFGDIFRNMGSILSERRYYEKGKEYALQQSVGNNYMDENGLPTTNWNEAEITHIDPIVFNANDDPNLFVINEHDVFYENRMQGTASYEYNETDGYYTIKFELDPDKATTKSRIKIKDSIGDKNAYYTYLSYEITIWDNGYFRTYNNDSYFAGKVVIGLDFKDIYRWSFSYNEEDCGISIYADAAGIRDKY